jgi:hypothetical protein
VAPLASELTFIEVGQGVVVVAKLLLEGHDSIRQVRCKLEQKRPLGEAD